ncbi:MAG TPA: hypothetical protein VNN62_11575 [Methylomirabilota bacterium]|jgi:Tol biopolymer transport system component|nr:hypothetical protein [Methylomirabilota bacterium]
MMRFDAIGFSARSRMIYAIVFSLLFGLLASVPLAVAHRQPGSEQGPHAAASSAEKDARQAQERLLTHVRQVTFADQRAGEGYFSRDGSLLIFQSERKPGNPFYQMYVLNLTNGDIRRVSPGYGKTTCGWIHPDGRHVLFASTHRDPDARAKQKKELAERASGEQRRYSWDFDEHYDLFQADLTTGSLTPLAPAHGYDAEASWSPDGSLIVFASNRHAFTDALSDEERKLFTQDASSQIDIYLMHADGTHVRRLTNTLGYDGGPFFSADGKKIVWRRFSPVWRDSRSLDNERGWE